MNRPRCLPSPGAVCRLLPISLAFAVACGPALHPLPARPESDPSILLARMEARQAGLRTLSAVGRAESRTSDGTVRGRVTVLADLAGRLRVDAWTPTDVLVGAIWVGPEGFTYIERGSPSCVVGTACPSNLGRFLPVGWDLESMVRALMGIPPIREVVGPWSLEFDRKVGAYRLASALVTGGTQRLWLREDGAAVRYERDHDGRAELRLDVERPGDGAGAPARKVRLRAGRGGTELAVRYTDVEANPEVPDEDWPLDCPDGTQVQVLPCQEGR